MSERFEWTCEWMAQYCTRQFYRHSTHRAMAAEESAEFEWRVQRDFRRRVRPNRIRWSTWHNRSAKWEMHTDTDHLYVGHENTAIPRGQEWVSERLRARERVSSANEWASRPASCPLLTTCNVIKRFWLIVRWITKSAKRMKRKQRTLGWNFEVDAFKS